MNLKLHRYPRRSPDIRCAMDEPTTQQPSPSPKRRVFIREHLYKNNGQLDEIEFEFSDDLQSSSSIERNYSLWLTRDHYRKALVRRYGPRVKSQPTFDDYVNTLRVLIAGHCSAEHDRRQAFAMIDQNQNGLIDSNEFERVIGIIGRSVTEEKLARVNLPMDYDEFKRFVRLGFGRELLMDVSMDS